MKLPALLLSSVIALASVQSTSAAYLCTGTPTETGRCGPSANNARCMRAGDFCSVFGWCGSTDAHKSTDQCGGPSPGFYTCKGVPRADNRCGREYGNAGCAQAFDYCSRFGWCGNTTAHKDSDQCGGPSPGGVAPGGSTYKCLGPPTETNECGPNFNNARCQRAGDYCSTFGWCGSSPAHQSLDQCGGPSPGFYTCKGVARTDNRCGRDFGGAGCSKVGDYCSTFGWCGNSADHKASDQCGGPSPGGPNPSSVIGGPQPPEPRPEPRPQPQPQPLPAPRPPSVGSYRCLGVPTETGQCGPRFGNARCMRAGDFCSRFGWCGSTPEHRSSDQCNGASPGFYTCTAAPRADNRCGREYGNAGCAQAFDYCSRFGWCGNTTAHKQSDQCGGPSPGGANPSGLAFPNYKCRGAPTETGECGPRFGNARCMRAGDFCSTFGWCGSSDAHKSTDQCGGASPGFYTCTGAPRDDNRCGSEYGNAGCAKPFDYCSKFGWCGNSAAHKESDQCGGPSPGGANPAGASL